MSDPIPRPLQAGQQTFTPNPHYEAAKKDERNDAVSIDYIRLAVEHAKGRDMTPKQVADAADMFWEWSQAEQWKRG